MKALFLLVVLGQNGAGDISASFVNTQTLAQCQQKEAMVKAIFSTAGLPVLESRCMRSELQFTEFGHGESTSTPRHFYLFHVGDKQFDIKPVADWRSCMLGQKAGVEQGKIYCGSSIQALKRDS